MRFFNKLTLYFLLPFLVLAILGTFLIPEFNDYAKEIIGFALLTIILFCPLFYIRSAKIKKKYIYIVCLLLSLLAFVKISFYYVFGVKISSSALYVIFETNSSEASQFLNSYFLILIIVFALFTTAHLILISKTLKNETFRFLNTSNRFYKFVPLFTIVSAIVILNLKFRDIDLFIKTYDTYQDYKFTKKLLKSELAKPTSNFLEVKKTVYDTLTAIIVIGESTSNWHMQLYGYGRKTNPKLNEIKNELLVFDSVIAPNVHTILSLEKTLTFSKNSNVNKPKNASLVQLANMSGFTTYWISNQKPIGVHESISTLIASAANDKYFLETDNTGRQIFDESVFETFDMVLQEKDPLKMIFIQLAGTHFDYDKRYPEAFSFFKDKPKTGFPSEKAFDIINNYDNAVRYNDSIISTLISKININCPSSYLIYFSDHGDEVYDTMDMFGHNEYYSTRPMYEIPFIVWGSTGFKKNNPFFKYQDSLTSRRYNLEDFVHSFSDISGIKHPKIDSTRSIFSSKFKARTRLIKENIDYDQKNKK